jgi:hypothetical protein
MKQLARSDKALTKVDESIWWIVARLHGMHEWI